MGYDLNCLDEPVFIAESKPLLTEFGINLRLESCVPYLKLRSRFSRCLEPGKYVSHLERWLSYYKSGQLTIVDGEELVDDPVSVMNRLQYFLSVTPTIDYADHLTYDAKKGFYCQIMSGLTTNEIQFC